MKRILILLAFIVSNVCSGQTVTAVDAYQSGDDIIIMYSVGGTSYKKFNVVPSFSTDGGRNYTQLKSVTGDLKNLYAGDDKVIRWKVLQDYTSFVHSSVIFKIDLKLVQTTSSSTYSSSSYNSSSSSSKTSSSSSYSAEGESYYIKGQECERNKKYSEAIKNYKLASQKGYKKADERIKELQLKFW